jgi:SAM-dependent methyltransferase
MSMSDPAVVGAEYVDETRLAVRKAAHSGAEGPDAREVLFDAIVEAQPRRILELGPGEGELAERLVRELGTEVIAVDQSERMVEITRGKGVDAPPGARRAARVRGCELRLRRCRLDALPRRPDRAWPG